MKTLRVGIIGCGVIGPTHAESYLMQDGVAVVWACDLMEDRARRLAETFHIPRVTQDYREILADPDTQAVSVCTGHAAHAAMAAAALEAGKHVLCEKALSINPQGMDLMLAAHARRPDLVFEGVFQHRFDPINQYVRGLVERGAFGTILNAGVQVRCYRAREYYRDSDWRGTWDGEGGSILINQSIHSIDALAWIMGGVVAVSGRHANLAHGDVLETEDTAVAMLQFKCGALGTLEATAASNLDWETTYSIHGTAGSVEIRTGQVLKAGFSDKEQDGHIREDLRACRDLAGAVSSRSHYGTSHPAQIADFISAIRENRPPFVPARSARHAVDIVLGIYQSQRDGGRWVDLPA